MGHHPCLEYCTFWCFQYHMFMGVKVAVKCRYVFFLQKSCPKHRSYVVFTVKTTYMRYVGPLCSLKNTQLQFSYFWGAILTMFPHLVCFAGLSEGAGKSKECHSVEKCFAPKCQLRVLWRTATICVVCWLPVVVVVVCVPGLKTPRVT